MHNFDIIKDMGFVGEIAARVKEYGLGDTTRYLSSIYINNLEIPLILINTFLTLFVPALVLRLYLKKLGWDGELDGNKNFVAKIYSNG